MADLKPVLKLALLKTATEFLGEGRVWMIVLESRSRSGYDAAKDYYTTTHYGIWTDEPDAIVAFKAVARRLKFRIGRPLAFTLYKEEYGAGCVRDDSWSSDETLSLKEMRAEECAQYFLDKAFDS